VALLDIIILISILIAAITALSSVISAILYVKKMKKEEPNIVLQAMKKSYESQGRKINKKTVIFNIELLFENKGNAPGSITDLLFSVRYAPQVLEKYPWVQDMVNYEFVISNRPENFSKIIPIDVASYGSKKVLTRVKFEKVFAYYLERCFMPIDFRNPKKWDWEDLPIYVQITAKYTKGTITGGACVFRKDMPESKEVSGSIYPLEHFEIERKFTPKIKVH
jgi:hypothetical protein